MESLRRLAYLLCQDRDRVDDLVQTAITRLYVRWARAREIEYIDAYTRTILVRVYLKDRASGWATRVDRSGLIPDAAAMAQDPEATLDMRAALARLAPRQRATLVLRFYCDLSTEQTAEMLGCSPGTVKSQTAKGLAALRAHLEPHPVQAHPQGPRGHRPSVPPPSSKVSGHG
jgi:RNA polymerase sigma-70 factor (sigma-E family)